MKEFHKDCVYFVGDSYHGMISVSVQPKKKTPESIGYLAPNGVV